MEAAARRELTGTPDRAIPLSTKLSGAEGVVRTPLDRIQQPSSFPPHPLIVKAIRSRSFHRIKIATMPLQNNWKAHFIAHHGERVRTPQTTSYKGWRQDDANASGFKVSLDGSGPKSTTGLSQLQYSATMGVATQILHNAYLNIMDSSSGTLVIIHVYLTQKNRFGSPFSLP